LKFDDLGTDEEKPDPHQWADLLEVDPDFRKELFRAYEDDGIKEADDESSPEISDVQFLNMELALPRDDEGPEFARVTKRLRDDNGNPVGRASNNLITDTRVFEVEYADGHTATMSATAMSQCMFEQVDQEGNRFLLFEDVIYHRSTKDAVTQMDAFTTASNGRKSQSKLQKVGNSF
jgi:hypothetical protein